MARPGQGNHWLGEKIVVVEENEDFGPGDCTQEVRAASVPESDLSSTHLPIHICIAPSMGSSVDCVLSGHQAPIHKGKSSHGAPALPAATSRKISFQSLPHIRQAEPWLCEFPRCLSDQRETNWEGVSNEVLEAPCPAPPSGLFNFIHSFIHDTFEASVISLAHCASHIEHILPTLPVWSAFCYSNRCLKYQLTKRRFVWAHSFECLPWSIPPIVFGPVAGVWSRAKALSSWPGIREETGSPQSPSEGMPQCPEDFHLPCP